MKGIDLRRQKRIGARDIRTAAIAGAKEIFIREGASFTPSAREMMRQFGIIAKTGGRNRPEAGSLAAAEKNNLEQAAYAYGRPETTTRAVAPKVVNPEIERLLHSPAVMAIKEEICAVGWKLWMRSYVDGNGGNISCRIGENAVLCTPTLLSKIDLKPEDLCLVDIDGNQIAGELPRTSEVFLHLEIYKNVPKAKAVVHCHPPHATAYAITGRIPPSAVIPEFDVFVGSVAITNYETPGTKTFAETVIPFVKDHNTVLLGNHGIVCWADTPTHAEWYAENLETYCWTLLISQQLGIPFERIPPAKEQDLLAIKKRLGLPDARFHADSEKSSGLPEPRGAIALVPPGSRRTRRPLTETVRKDEVEAIVRNAVDAVMAAIKSK
jgi:L-fuculose-phosphate aldolase